MKKKAKGRRYEYKTIELLEVEGYTCIRAAASLGLFDIVAIGNHLVLLVQVKANRWPRATEIEKIEAFECPAYCKKLVYRWMDYSRKPDIKVLS